MPKKGRPDRADFTIDPAAHPVAQVKRRQVEKNIQDLIDRVYAQADPTAGPVEG